MKSLRELARMFDATRIANITIRMPVESKAPLTFDALKGTIVRDENHRYLIVTYNDGDPSIAFACTSSIWAPHKAPMMVSVADTNTGLESGSVWSSDMRRATAVDLSRMASFPPSALRTHFQDPASSTATDPVAVITAIKHVVLAHASLNGVSDEGEEGSTTDELNIGHHDEYHDDLDLVIGHYEVDEDNLPVPGALA